MQITFKQNPINTQGSLPAVGTEAPDFTLIDTNLAPVKLSDFKGKKVLLNIFPSVDTGICAMSVREFNKDASQLQNTVVLCISKDLPFAHKRFCAAEGIENVHSLSDFRNPEFADLYQTIMLEGPLAGLHSRAVVAIDENGKITYTEQVPEITQEPNYSPALEALK